METGPVIIDLRKEEKLLQEKIDSLQAELSSTETELSYVRRMIQRNTQDQSKQQPVFPSLESQQVPEQAQGLRPTEALREVFNEAPHKRWSPVELKERLEKLRSENRLQSTSRRLWGATHTALGALMHSGYIQKHTDGKSPTYSKKVSQYGSAPISVRESRQKSE